MDEIKKLGDQMNLDRTEGLFDASIKKAKALETAEYTPDDIKKSRLVIGFGNLHLNTARTKLSAIRFLGYQNNLKAIKDAVERKQRDSNKYPEGKTS